MRTAARAALALITGLLVTAGLLSATTAPASAGQVGVTVSIKGAGSVHVVEGSIEDGGPTACVLDHNQDHNVTLTCPRIRNSEALEAWVWLRPTPSAVPAGEWEFQGWTGCDTTRFRDGEVECGVHSAPFSSAERYPVAAFRDTVAPTITNFEVRQEPDMDYRFRVSFATTSGARTECRSFGNTEYKPCANDSLLALPEGRHTIQLRATDASGNATVVDRTVISLDTQILVGPAEFSSSTWADFMVRMGAGTRISCSVDRAAWVTCGNASTGQVIIGPLPDGPHTLDVRVANGTWIDPVPARWTWTIDTVVPTTSMNADVRGNAASFTFMSSEPVHYQCKLDTPAGPGEWDWCSSPVSYAGLAEGEHLLSVKARDDAFNRAEVMTHRWAVDTFAPTTTLVPSASVDAATFTFSAPGATSYQCRLTTPAGTGSWARCSAPTSYAGLTPGAHRFEVRATDAAGNVEVVPATHAWTATAPVVGPPAPAPVPEPAPVPGTPAPDVPATKAVSVTKAAWKVSSARKGKVTVVVAAASAPTGTVIVKDGARIIGRATLTVSDQGRIVVKLPRLRAGKHVLVVKYAGSATVAGSSSAKRTATLR